MSWRWFKDISGVEAEELLMTAGVDGSFLIRPSKSNPGDYTLSARSDSHVSHVKISYKGDRYDIGVGKTFATLEELVQFYTHDELRQINGPNIRLKHPIHKIDYPTESWYHGSISARDAEEELRNKGKNWSYLVRECQSRPGEFVVCVRRDERGKQPNITHLIIKCMNTKQGIRYRIEGSEMFYSLIDLIQHYKSKPMKLQTGEVLQLKHPLKTSSSASEAKEQKGEQGKLGKFVKGVSDIFKKKSEPHSVDESFDKQGKSSSIGTGIGEEKDETYLKPAEIASAADPVYVNCEEGEYTYLDLGKCDNMAHGGYVNIQKVSTKTSTE